jgi:hypothetical protein
MGAAIYSDDELGRVDQFYRFSVKCDRVTNDRIEKAARAAGVSATTFVQRHFETILDEPTDGSGFSPDAFAREHKISPQAARVWRAMLRAADNVGVVSGGVRDFAIAAKVATGRGGDHLAELARAGLVKTLARAGANRPGTYRVLQSGGGFGQAS